MQWLEVPLRVRYGETDQMGHAYYANYLLWFEVARSEWCRARGFTYKSLEEKGFFLPVVEVWVRYRGEIHYDDEILVKIRLSEMKSSSTKFDYQIVRAEDGANNQILTEAYTWHVLMSRERKSVKIPDWLREKFNDSGDFCVQ